MVSGLDRDVTALARRIAELGQGERSRVFRMSWWSERMLDWAMANPGFKTQLFRLVDVFPALAGDRGEVMSHVHDYFEGHDVPKALDLGIGVAEHVPFGQTLTASVAQRNIRRMAEQFIVGASAADAVEGLHQLWRTGSAFTLDLLGEKTVTQAEADRYQARALELLDVVSDAAVDWAPDDHLERDPLGSIPRVNVSIKPSALATHYEPLSRQEGIRSAKERIRPILRLARQRGAFVHVDMEHYAVKDLTLELFRDLLSEDEFADMEAGIVVQAYLKDSRDDLADLIAWSSSRRRPITVRLVKGAYWDTESAEAAAQGWPSPVYEHKVETDANFERCVRLLHDHHGDVRAAFGSHNLRSLAYAITYGRHKGIADSGYEIQMLYGMAEPMHAAIKRLGMRLRVYSPVGELVPGMAYLVRRLLENTSNESFVRHRFAEGRKLNELLDPPHVGHLPSFEPPASRTATDPAHLGAYHHEPVAEWRRSSVRSSFQAAIDAAAQTPMIEVPALIAGEEVRTTQTIESVDPGDHGRLVARSASCTDAEANTAVAVALEVEEQWRHTAPSRRAAVLFEAADTMRRRRNELAALEVFEAGKPWAEADADVCEAIDFCEYYGREILRLAEGGRVLSVLGESNVLSYQGKGVTAVIAPWNFPLAIACGMTTAALAAGNPVILKPAEQTPAVAWHLATALTHSLAAAGLPSGVFQFLPGIGEAVGARLVEHPGVACIAFTGSREVGLQINQTAAVTQRGQRQIKRVVAELGGKNALIIDADADPDQAVPAAVYSAFGYAGQKCSAAAQLIVLDRVYDQIVERVVAATREVIVGHAKGMDTLIGPVIDADAYKRVTGAIERAPDQGKVLVARNDVPDGGWYVGPTVVAVDDPSVSLACEEIFGPVLTVLRARDFDDAMRLANRSEYGLTAGIFSRSPSHIRLAAAELRAGNVYINRPITGAIVGRQPFGGYGMSGVGSKAGGPDYLLQFLDPRVVTENTVRQGVVPES